ncbi:MAG: discoidin domain-containing protein [Clostridia bacterium]|nr:discoidin domain-containing protein [Clostridia bacterium]
MKKLLLIALLMLTIVFAAVACKDNTSKPADTTVEDGTTAEPTTTVAPETTAEPETTITETTAPETTVEETTAPETTAPETTVEETTVEETTVEETTAEETTVEETTAEETEPETVVVPENATNVALGAGVNASEAFIAGPWHPDNLVDGLWSGTDKNGWINNVAGPTADEITIILTLQDVYVLYEASLYPGKGTGAATPGSDFPKAYELMVSEDGENWITVATDANVDATAASDAELQPKVYNFGKAVKAKYFAIKITEHSSQTHDSGPNGILPKTILGEIELAGTQLVEVPENATNVALGAGVNASDAFIAGPWHSDALTDGIWTGVEADGPLGWLNGIDKTPAAEQVMIILTLKEESILYEALLYPAKGSGAAKPGMDFPKAYELMVSEDGENWITVAMDANVDATAASDAELQPKVYNFGEAVKAKYFAIKITAHSDRMLFNGTADVPMSIIGEVELNGVLVDRQIKTDKDTYNAGEAINATAFGFGTDEVKLFLKADFEAGNFDDYIYRYSVGFDSGKTVNILDEMANPNMFAYHTVPAGEYVVAVVNAAGTVIDSKVITVVGSIDVENPGEDAGVVEVPDGAKDAADVNQNDKLTGDIATGLNLGGVWTIYEFNLIVDGDYKLQVSVDGSAWTTVTLTEDGKLTAPVLAQYIRFEGNVTAVEIKATFLGEPETDPVPDENAPEIEDDFVEVPENATNVALDAYVFATEGFVVGPWHSDNLVDGLWSGTEKNGWISDVNSGVPSGDVTITLTLKEMSILYQVLLYPGKGSCLAGEKSGSDFPKAYEVMVSEDGIRWTTVAVATDVDATADSDDELKPVVHHFKKAIMAKYVAIKITEHCDVLFPSGFGPMPYSVLGEIKVTGTVVETEAPAPVEIPDNLTNVALGATVNATTSWTANSNFWDNSYLTDGSWMAIEGGNEKLGWRNSPDSKSPDSFTIILELDEVSTIYQAVLCPERFQSGMWFPKGYDMLVSMDGETWTVVESVTGVTVAPNSETDIPALTYTFDEAVTAKYFCLRITQHSGNTFNGGYGDIEVSAIGEIMLNGVAAN